MYKKIISFFVILMFMIVIVGFFLPSKWEVVKSALIKAPPEKIYPYVANLKTGWPQWSRFDHIDPTIVYTYSGSDIGVGAERTWKSQKMGNGTQKIVKADPKTGIEFVLNMVPNNIPIHGEITFMVVQEGTNVTWRDYGEIGLNPFHRYMGVMMSKMMGDTFEESLSKLKEISENVK